MVYDIYLVSLIIVIETHTLCGKQTNITLVRWMFNSIVSCSYIRCYVCNIQQQQQQQQQEQQMFNNNKLAENRRPMLLLNISKLLNKLIIYNYNQCFHNFIVNSQVEISSKLSDITGEDIYPIKQ